MVRWKESAFQSLFFWIHFHKPGSGRLMATTSPRFNPCFSGFTSTSDFSFDLDLDDLVVSILVFLDSLPQASGLYPCFHEKTCFNPCFSGFTSTRGIFPFLAGDERTVSILVFLDSLPQAYTGAGFYSLQSGFNPCFSGFTSTSPRDYPP